MADNFVKSVLGLLALFLFQSNVAYQVGWVLGARNQRCQQKRHSQLFSAKSQPPQTTTQSSKYLKDFENQYDSFFLDQFGVIHNGTHAYQGAIEAVERLAQRGKRLVILSNSSKRKKTGEKNLRKMGFNPDHFCGFVTSGDTVYEEMISRAREPFKSLGTRCVVFGNADDDKAYLSEMQCELSTIEEADFLLARGNFVILDAVETTKCDRSLESEARVAAVLAAAAARGLPLLVANPDIARPGCGSPMPGVIGKQYEDMGGTVHYTGKPHSSVYELCFQALEEDGGNRDRVCAVGDSLDHDILGASRADIESIFIIGGIHSEELGIKEGGRECPSQKALEKLYARHGGGAPTHSMPAFVWED